MGRSRRKKKRSAGLLVLAGRRLLLVQRSRKSATNARTWGLPGGQRDDDEKPLKAARRETREELGALPPGEVVGKVRVNRPKAGPYDVFVKHAPKKTRGRFEPRLNREHSEWQWARLSWVLANRDKLHPVLRRLFSDDGAVAALCETLDADAPGARTRRAKTLTV